MATDFGTQTSGEHDNLNGERGATEHRVNPAANCVSTTDRPHCRTRNACKAQTPGKHCPGCSLSALHKDPAFREKRAQAFRDRLVSDPAFREKHNAASAARLAKWRKTDPGATFMNANSHANLARANTPEGQLKRRASQLAGIPQDRWDEYTGLARRMPAAEARRIILADIAATERRRLAAMTPFERQMDRLANGARLVEKPVLRRVEPNYTLGGVATGAL